MQRPGLHGQPCGPPFRMRASAAQGKVWGFKDLAPGARHPGRRQSNLADSTVPFQGAFWLETYEWTLNGATFVQLLKNTATEPVRPVHLLMDELPLDKRANVKEYVAGTEGKHMLDFCRGTRQISIPISCRGT